MKRSQISAHKGLIGALNADILYEVETADDCLQRAGSAPQQYRGCLQKRADRCTAAALRNAIALAAEVLLLGGTPPGPGPRRQSNRRAAESIEEYIAQARSAVMHYQRRLAMAERLELTRLREVFREIVVSKRRHLAHAGLVAAEGHRSRQLS